MSKTHTVKPMNLHLFDGTGDGAAAPVSGQAGMSEQQPADNAQSATGRSAESTTDTQDAAAESEEQVADSLEKARADFEAYINGDGKQFYQEKLKEDSKEITQKAINKRFAKTKTLEARDKALTPMIEAIARAYGVDPKDANAVASAFFNDDKQYEERARENGVTVEVQKKFDQLEMQNAMLKQQQQELEKAKQTQQIINDWNDQAEEFAKIVPGFDLDAALDNEDFYDLVVRGYGVKAAYAAAFPDEYEQRIAVQAEKRVTDNIRSRGMRTQENGTSQTATARERFDIANLSAAQLRDFANRAERGETITFR